MTASVLVGGVGQLYQGDFDVGRVIVERLAGEPMGSHVLVEDLHYGAVAVAQRLEELRPAALVLVGAAERGGPAGTVRRRRVRAADLGLGERELQAAVGDAVTGYVTVDLVVEVGHALGVLPQRTVAVEVEPAHGGPDEHLSPAVAAAVDDAVALARAEARRAPLLELADELRVLVDDGHLSGATGLGVMRDLLRELRRLDDDGRWGTAFACRDRLRQVIARGETADGMSHLDWSLWWALIEEVDRLQGEEAAGPHAAP